jgi:group II intron reverse transcriptase/maturase
MENVRDIMRNPESVLNSLSEHSQLPNYKFERLYRILFNEEMFYAAYQRIYAKAGNMTKGSDNNTIDEMSLSRIEQLIGALRNETYQPNPSRRTYIPKKNGKKRPLGVPTFDDKLVQEVLRMILEAIFEKQFENCSHGFRPMKSCHTALIQVKTTFRGVKWFIEGDIKGFFDNINHDVLINILKERIEDERLIRLIRKFLNAGYIEDWVFHNTYSGTPQGGIVSPILANIYLDKLDKYMKDYINDFNKGERRKSNPETPRLQARRSRLVRKLKVEKDEAQQKLLIDQIRSVEKERILVSYGDEMDANYRKLKYVRYADDFLIGIIGSLKDCKQIKKDIKTFLDEKLKLELSEEKTLITHSETPARFLSFDILIRKSNLTKRDAKTGSLSRIYNKRAVLKMPADIVRKKLIEYGAVTFTHHNGQEQWKPFSRGLLLNKDDLELVSQYNSEIIGFYNYYSIAVNVGAMNTFKYYMQYSMYKTFGRKYQMSVPAICRKYYVDGHFTVFYTNKNGEQKRRVFYNEGFKQKKETIVYSVDDQPDLRYTLGRTSLIDRLKASKCELCGASEVTLQMHHIRKMSDVKEGKEPWQVRMIARRRKTIAVCTSCHRKIHNWRID